MRWWQRADLWIMSVFINILALAVPIYVVQALTRYLSTGVDSTLYALTFGVLLSVFLEYLFRSYRRLALAELDATSAAPKNFFAIISAINFADVSAKGSGVTQQKLKAFRESFLNSKIQKNEELLDLPFCALFLLVIYLLSPIALLIVTITVLLGLAIKLLQIRGLSIQRNQTTQLDMNVDSYDLAVTKNLGLLNLFVEKKAFLKKYQIEQAALSAAKMRVLKIQLGDKTNVTGLVAVLTVLIVFTSAISVFEGGMQIGTLLALNILAARCFIPLYSLPTHFGSKKRNLLFEEFFKKADSNEQNSRLSTLREFTGQVKLAAVHQKYQGQKIPLFEGFDHSFDSGSVTVVTGKNGSGKTTLFNLLTGVIEPNQGSISIDGVHLQQLSPDWWRKQLTAVPQEPAFTDASIFENLKQVSQDIKAERIWDVIHRCGLNQYFDETDEGINAHIELISPRYSLGIRKRLALARAMLIDGKFVIMDEPTEGLDVDGAQIFYRYLNDCIKQQRTVVVLSHDHAIIRGAQNIISLDSRPHPTVRRVKRHERQGRQPTMEL